MLIIIYVSGNLLNSNGKQFENKITQNTDISLNNVKIHGNIEIIGNGDASFNSVNVTSLNVNGSSVTGDINGISEDTYSRYSPNISGTSATWNSGTTENAIKFSKHLIPSANDTYDIGGTGGARWNSLHVKDIFVSGNSIFSESIKAISVGNDGSISMPAGTKIGGVNPATVKIVLVVDNSGNLPDNVYYQIGDGIITEDTGNLHVNTPDINSGNNVWVNVGSFRGPIGNQGLLAMELRVIRDILDLLECKVILVFKGFTGYGAQGFTGVQGYTGFQGFTGIQGLKGFQGYQGLKGDIGYQGHQGRDGAWAAFGFQGFTGYTGSKGEKGVQGYTGYTGFQGFTGFQRDGQYAGIGYQGHRGIYWCSGLHWVYRFPGIYWFPGLYWVYRFSRVYW